MGAAGLASTRVRAATYPERPVRILVGFPAGGFTDILARAVAEPLSQALGQRFLIENQSGGAGTLAATAAASAQPDGYTLVMGNMIAHAAAKSMMKHLRYDPATAFMPITICARQGSVVVTRPELGIRSIAELVEKAKAAPGKYSYASSGSGSTQHLSGEQFQQATGIKLIHVPYRGSAPALNDVIAGHVDFAFDGVGSANAHLQAGSLVPLAFALPARAARYPDVPTLEELGIKGFTNGSWFGLFAPADTPKPIVGALYRETTKALDTPIVKRVLEDSSAWAGGEPPEQVAAFIQEEITRLGDLVRLAKISVE
ncbi:MAG: tripartite tricarboxylate transporter substrate binding protein [Rhizobiales bacterium]|nr:tripartite tricarboxylate transporter substrate binding protein [Hyphomicrobiales bacterium]